jgi:hypothetical protein
MIDERMLNARPADVSETDSGVIEGLSASAKLTSRARSHGNSSATSQMTAGWDYLISTRTPRPHFPRPVRS